MLLAALLVLGTVFLRGDGCIMKEKVFEIVLFSETSAEFPQNETSATFANPAVVDFDQDLDDALAEAGYSRGDIISAEVQAGHYGALNNESAHDWIISGQITMERLGPGGTGPVTAMTYTSQSVDAAIGKKIKAPIEPGAIDIVNDALAEYLDGQQGIQMEFVIDNGSAVGPQGESPSGADPMVFRWKAWITITVILSDEADWPDPF
jgi:hypothetical protein